MNVVLLGPPGAGKGTQAGRIAERFGLAKLSTGDMLRAAVADGSEIGRLVAGPMARGELVPDEMIIRMIVERIDRPDCRNGFILDGFPRTLRQAEALDEVLAERHIRLDHIVEFRAEEDALVRRVAGRYQCAKCHTAYHEQFNTPRVEGVCDVCGSREFTRRPDDTAETARARLGEYRRQTGPVLDYYRRRGVLRSVDAMAEIDTVTGQVNAILGAG